MAKGPGAKARNGGNSGQGTTSGPQTHEELRELLMAGFKGVGERFDDVEKRLGELEGGKKENGPFAKYFDLTTGDSFAKAAGQSKAAQSMAYLHFHQARHLAMAEGAVNVIGRIGNKLGFGRKPA